MTHKKLLQNIYKASKHHRDLNMFLANNLLRDDLERKHAKGCQDAYEFIIQMIVHWDTIGSVDYAKVFKTEEFRIPNFIE
jgi:hypothetical protein